MPRTSNDDAPVSAIVGRRGIKTSADFADFFAALMSDVVEGLVDPNVAAAACKAGDKLLQIVNLQMQHGKELSDGRKVLQLSGDNK